ncbi:helix-turn-helix domain-containing protein [Rhizobium leguminosarum bv. viciae]|nr:helix-turn-helix domain-containing protein [Rhizobium leguminosarum bv. viciae]
MTLNVKLVEVATVPIGLPHRTELKLSVRGLSCSRLIAADVNYGFKPTETNPDFPTWEGAYSIGVHFNDERSEVFLDGRYYSHPNRKGQTHFLYVSELAHIDFTTPRHTQEVILQRSFMREIANDLEVPHVTHLGNSLYHMTDDPVLRRLALRIYPFFDAPETMDPLMADHYMWSLGIYLCAHYGDLTIRRPIVGGLSTWQERLAKDVIETSLVGGVGLAELAQLCGLRTSQFAHGFKRSTGVAPYEWLLRRRIERAKESLLWGHKLSEVALACGFADESHLTRMFRRVVGVTPGAWRATRASAVQH